MKRKIISILFVLVLALTLSLVPAVPVSAASVTSGDFDITVSADDAVDAGNSGAAIGTVTMDAAQNDADGTTSIVLVIQSGDYQWVDAGTADDGTADGEGWDTVAGVITTTTTTKDTLTFADTGANTTAGVTVNITGATIAATVGAGIAATTDVLLSYDGTVAAITNEDIGNVTEVAGTATKLIFTVDPAGSVSGQVFSTQPTIEAQDQFGNKDTTFGDNITISVETGPGALDIGTATQAMTNGTLTTSGLGYTATADQEDFTLAANDDGLDLTEGVSGTVTCDVVATKLVFTTQPAGSVSGSALTTQPVVEAQDANNMKDTDYVTNVVASENDAGTLAGTLTVTPALGIATFTDLVYTATANGEIFQIEFDSGGLPQVTSADVVSVIPTWGGGWAPPTPTIETNLFGKVSRFRFHITTGGEIRDTIQATSEDGMLTMTIPKGTIALDKDGNPLSTLTSDVDVSPPPPPSHIIGLAYDLGPDGATFDPAITLNWNYDPDALPEGVAEEDLVIDCYDEEAGEWEECPSTVDLVTHTVTASVSHFTCFAIIAHAAPAAFSASNLSIQPSEVQPKEAVTITLSVANTGGTEGSYAVVLKINDVAEATKEVTVDAGASKEVTFTTSKDVAGSYSVAVNGLSGSFTVKEKPVPAPPPPPPAPPPEVKAVINWPVVGGIIAVVVVVGLLIFFLVVRRRA